MTKFSDFIRDPGTAGPPTRDGIKSLGFVLDSDIPTALAKYLWLGGAQAFTGGEKTQGRANLGVVIGTDVQAFDAGLLSIAGLTTVADRMLYTTGADVYATCPLTPFARALLDDADAATARATLALGNVDNTSDANKPVSTAQQAALDLKAPLASPALTGVPTAPTAAPGTNTTQLATMAALAAALAALPAYSENTFTPRLDGTTTPGVGTYTLQFGKYTRIGRLVQFEIGLSWSAHTGTGNFILSGLPFVSSNAAVSNVPVSIAASALTFSNQLIAMIPNNSSQVQIRTIASGAGVGDVPVDTTGSLWISGSYTV